MGGATYTDVVRKQLPLVDLKTADIVTVESSNDVEKRVNLDTYRMAVEALMRVLPPEKTVVSDLHLEPGRNAYQAILQANTDVYHILRADFARIFTNEGRRLDIFSWLPPHLNSKGLLTVAKFHRLSYTIFNFLIGTRDLDGKTRTETLASECSGS